MSRVTKKIGFVVLSYLTGGLCPVSELPWFPSVLKSPLVYSQIRGFPVAFQSILLKKLEWILLKPKAGISDFQEEWRDS